MQLPLHASFCFQHATIAKWHHLIFHLDHVQFRAQHGLLEFRNNTTVTFRLLTICNGAHRQTSFSSLQVDSYLQAVFFSPFFSEVMPYFLLLLLATEKQGACDFSITAATRLYHADKPVPWTPIKDQVRDFASFSIHTKIFLHAINTTFSFAWLPASRVLALDWYSQIVALGHCVLPEYIQIIRA